MLTDELARRPINKAARNRALQAMTGRSKGSIEFKHQNISAVLLGLGQPWIDGYKPKANFQNALVDGVLRWLEAQPEMITRSAISLPKERRSLRIGPPPTMRNEPSPIDPAFMAAIGRKNDVAARDARNRALGKAGEECVLHHERHSLCAAGRDDLASKVRWTSVQDGDGLGFDILSFDADGRERLIEVKTTNGWERTPFHISRNELAIADARPEEWCLMRLWNFARAPSAFSLRSPLNDHTQLTATSFLAELN